MSSGGAVIPLGALLLLPGAAAAVVLAAALAGAGVIAVLVARAAMAGAEALAGGVARIGELMEAQRDSYVEAARAAEVWQLAAAEVVNRNARIAAIVTQARRAGIPRFDIPVPLAFDLAAKNLCEIREWCERTDKQLDAARAKLSAELSTQAARRLAELLPAADVRAASAAGALARGEAALAAAQASAEQAAEAASAAAAARRAREVAALADQVDALLARLDPQTPVADRAKALGAAAKAVTAEPPEAGRVHVDHLKFIVDEANRRTADAAKAAVLLQGLRVEPQPVDLGAAELAVAARLEEVVTGDLELDDDLEREAHRVLRTIEAAGLRAFLHEQVMQIMQENGWQVEDDFSTWTAGVDRLTLSGPGWDAHHLRIFVGDNEFGYVTLGDYPAEDDDAVRLDSQRCGEAAQAMEDLVGAMNARGSAVTLTKRSVPAVQYLSAERRTGTGGDRLGQPEVLRLREPGEEG